MNIFIDTNIFLNFFHYSSDELEELSKLIVLLQNNKVTLHLPEQVQHEFLRNRDNKIADALKRLRADNLSLTFPQMVKAYPEYETLRDAISKFDSAKKKLEKKLIEDIEKKKLKADQIIQVLFDLANNIPSDSEILSAALLRIDIGNPPGKNGSRGDAINWETLLKVIHPKEDLHFITEDADYCSEINNSSFKSFLQEEWFVKKNSRVHLYKNLSGFFKAHFPDIKLAHELAKELAIEELSNSKNFSKTHLAIAKLSGFTDYSDAQVNAIAKAAVDNSQVSWIAEDEDVHETLCEIILPKHEVVEEAVLVKFLEIYAPT